MTGTLYMVGTPIGNLGDISHRAIETFKMSDFIACEDTRRTENLLRFLGIEKPLIRYDEHVHLKASAKILELVSEGRQVSLVTDAGTPGLSDPGGRLVEAAVKRGCRVIPIPGPSSITAALSVSGLSGDEFIFLGFLPRKAGKARRILREAFGLGKTTVILESPYRIAATLDWVAEVCPKADVCLAREMTKMFEEFVRGDIETVRARLATITQKGEFVLVVKPREDKRPKDD